MSGIKIRNFSEGGVRNDAGLCDLVIEVLNFTIVSLNVDAMKPFDRIVKGKTKEVLVENNLMTMDGGGESGREIR